MTDSHLLFGLEPEINQSGCHYLDAISKLDTHLQIGDFFCVTVKAQLFRCEVLWPNTALCLKFKDICLLVSTSTGSQDTNLTSSSSSIATLLKRCCFIVYCSVVYINSAAVAGGT